MVRDPILIIVNPTSGRGRGQRTADAVAKALRRRGVDVTVRHTAARGEAQAIAAEATSFAASRGLQPARGPRNRFACIVACGGDGTIQEVANALALVEPTDSQGFSAPPMGLAPAGRCNDFARVLGVPTDPEGIADVLATGNPRAVDLGKVNDRYFCTVATLGIDAEVSSYVDKMRLPLSGTTAYLYGALCVLARYRPRRVTIEGDFGLIEQPVFLASSANTSVYGGAIRIAPDASPTDGLLDLCVIDGVSRLRSLVMLPRVLMGRHRSCPAVRFVRTKKFTIEADQPLELWADGELIARTPVTIEVAPAAVRVVLPQGEGSHNL